MELCQAAHERWAVAIQHFMLHLGCCSEMMVEVVAALLHFGMQIICAGDASSQRDTLYSRVVLNSPQPWKQRVNFLDSLPLNVQSNLRGIHIYMLSLFIPSPPHQYINPSTINNGSVVQKSSLTWADFNASLISTSEALEPNHKNTWAPSSRIIVSSSAKSSCSENSSLVMLQVAHAQPNLVQLGIDRSEVGVNMLLNFQVLFLPFLQTQSCPELWPLSVLLVLHQCVDLGLVLALLLVDLLCTQPALGGDGFLSLAALPHVQHLAIVQQEHVARVQGVHRAGHCLQVDADGGGTHAVQPQWIFLQPHHHYITVIYNNQFIDKSLVKHSN
ncbi:hypothetical protein E2C01_001530 [Portunus trituberculatus]|uniref:Uncharacterized protein n=1 Tax=Portunus trituberculatus TaxID=210409 RepID=A0A5B7CMQ4_PORTR|nr:hypothetical protein [Portunus trituberculatus]